MRREDVPLRVVRDALRAALEHRLHEVPALPAVFPAMPVDKPSVQVTAKLEGDAALDFEAFVRATMAPKASLVRQAIAELIEKALRENKGIAEQFNTYRVAQRRAHLLVIK